MDCKNKSKKAAEPSSARLPAPFALYHGVFEHAYESCQLGPHMRETGSSHICSQGRKNNATPWGYLLMCVRVCLRFCVFSVRVPLSVALLEGRGLEKEVSFDFENRKLVSVLVMEFGKE